MDIFLLFYGTMGCMADLSHTGQAGKKRRVQVHRIGRQLTIEIKNASQITDIQVLQPF
jgi:hypothetical protein